MSIANSLGELITSYEDALQYIQDHPGMTTDDLKTLAAQIDVNVDADVKLTYSGTIGTNGISSYEMSKAFEARFGSDVGTISQTDWDKLINTQAFKDAMFDSFSGTPEQKQLQLNATLYGTDLAGNRINATSIVDEGSHRYITTGSQDIINLVDNPTAGGV